MPRTPIRVRIIVSRSDPYDPAPRSEWSCLGYVDGGLMYEKDFEYLEDVVNEIRDLFEAGVLRGLQIIPLDEDP